MGIASEGGGWVLAEELAVVGGKLSHVPEAPGVGGIGHMDLSGFRTTKLPAHGIEAHGVDIGLGAHSTVFDEGVFKRAFADADPAAEVFYFW